MCECYEATKERGVLSSIDFCGNVFLILLRFLLLKDAMTCTVCRNELYLTSMSLRVIPLQREKEQQNMMK